MPMFCFVLGEVMFEFSLSSLPDTKQNRRGGRRGKETKRERERNRVRGENHFLGYDLYFSPTSYLAHRNKCVYKITNVVYDTQCIMYDMYMYVPVHTFTCTCTYRVFSTDYCSETSLDSLKMEEILDDQDLEGEEFHDFFHERSRTNTDMEKKNG